MVDGAGGAGNGASRAPGARRLAAAVGLFLLLAAPDAALARRHVPAARASAGGPARAARVTPAPVQDPGLLIWSPFYPPKVWRT